MRIFSNLDYFRKCKNTLLVPYSCLSKNTQKFFIGESLIDYGIKIKKDIKIYKNYITLNNPLALVYVVGFLISRNIKRIYLAGFDGYSKDETNQDSTFEMIDFLRKKYQKNKVNLASLTNTNFKLRKASFKEIKK